MCSTPNKESAELGWPGGEHLLVLNCFEHLLAMIHIKTFQCTALHAIQYTMHCILFTIVQCTAIDCNALQYTGHAQNFVENCLHQITLNYCMMYKTDLNRWPQDRGCAQFTEPMNDLHVIEGFYAIEQVPNQKKIKRCESCNIVALCFIFNHICCCIFVFPHSLHLN